MLADIQRFLDEAKGKKRRIWYSTILYTELVPSQLTKKFASVEALLADFEGVLLPVPPTPNILIRAGKIRDHSFHRAADKMQKGEKPKAMPVPDAIQLATCLFVKEVYEVPDVEFHTFDDGKGRKTHELMGSVSLLHLEDYAGHLQKDANVRACCALPRMKPAFAQQNLV